MATINPRVLYNPPFNSSTFNVIFAADLPTNLEVSPISGDLTRVVNDQALEQSMINIINTYVGERPYSDLGTALQLRLFENYTTIEDQLIKSAVQDSLRQYEPRVNVISQNIQVSAEGNYYTLEIVWNSNYSQPPKTLEVILQRSR